VHIWQILFAVILVLTAASWGTAITLGKSMWKKLQKALADYKAAVADGTITDAERIQLANDIIDALSDAAQLWQFIENLVLSIAGVVKRAKLRARQTKANSPPR
jgi:hypothetical protein